MAIELFGFFESQCYLEAHNLKLSMIHTPILGKVKMELHDQEKRPKFYDLLTRCDVKEMSETDLSLSFSVLRKDLINPLIRVVVI